MLLSFCWKTRCRRGVSHLWCSSIRSETPHTRLGGRVRTSLWCSMLELEVQKWWKTEVRLWNYCLQCWKVWTRQMISMSTSMFTHWQQSTWCCCWHLCFLQLSQCSGMTPLMLQWPLERISHSGPPGNRCLCQSRLHHPPSARRWLAERSQLQYTRKSPWSRGRPRQDQSARVEERWIHLKKEMNHLEFVWRPEIHPLQVLKTVWADTDSNSF